MMTFLQTLGRTLWSRSNWRLCRPQVLREAASGILLFGALQNAPHFEAVSQQVLDDLKARGLAISDTEHPVRVYQSETSSSFESAMSGAWKPGVIYLREASPIALRHELFHEASYRHCQGKLALWAEEAGAMAFSGEPLSQAVPSVDALNRLRKSVRLGARLSSSDYRTLSSLVAQYGWPNEKCAVSEEIAQVVHQNALDKSSRGRLDAILVSLISGKTVESVGNISEKIPPGSLLKIPYVASLKEAPVDQVGFELLKSDTAGLLLREQNLDFKALELLYSPLAKIELATLREKKQLGSLLGDREESGGFVVESSLPDLSISLRAALLLKPNYFSRLVENGRVRGSTLDGASEADLKIIEQLKALVKTGTVSNPRGDPLWGHLMLAWPRDNPEYLAIFRKQGVRGAALLASATKFIRQWNSTYQLSLVRVRVLSLLKPEQYTLATSCAPLELSQAVQGTRRTTMCGQFGVSTRVAKAKPERVLSGILSDENGALFLETDAETYANAVLDAEGGSLPMNAKKALKAVIIWNALHAQSRHPNEHSLCDTTHCMVFLGDAKPKSKNAVKGVDGEALRYLSKVARNKNDPWLTFSQGGTLPWKLAFSDETLARKTNEKVVLNIQRERRRDGEVRYHFTYPEHSEELSCEQLLKFIHFASCPAEVTHASDSWVFSGIGKGHGRGLQLERAKILAGEGKSALQILRDAWPDSGT